MNANKDQYELPNLAYRCTKIAQQINYISDNKYMVMLWFIEQELLNYIKGCLFNSNAIAFHENVIYL